LRIALGLLLGVFFSAAALFVFVATGVGLAQVLVYPGLSLSELPYVQATVERAYRSYTGPGVRSRGHCSLNIFIAEPPHHLVYLCDMPGVDAVERALAAPRPAVEIWYEPTLPLPDAAPQLWQLRVDGDVVLDREQVAAVYRNRTVPAVLLYTLFIGLGLLLGAIGVGSFLAAFSPSRT
jgi:hypothetical protein